jgi:hypothetical protein
MDVKALNEALHRPGCFSDGVPKGIAMRCNLLFNASLAVLFPDEVLSGRRKI